MSDLISAVCWVPRASAKTVPVSYEISKEELEDLEAMQELSLGEEGEEAEAAEMDDAEDDDTELPAALNMDSYDDPEGDRTFDDKDADQEMQEMKANDQDEHIDDDLGSDEEDFHLKKNDRVLLAAHTEEDYSCLEVHVYDEDTGSFYIHHDLTLPAFPLCMSWMGCGPNVMGSASSTGSKNYVAIGTFRPEIEIWNLDVLDALEPNVVLGGLITAVPQDSGSGKKKGKKKKKKPQAETRLAPGSHRDAVMGLSWNTVHENLLASSSADGTAKLWDVATQQCVNTWTHHTDKVQTVQWNPSESNILLAGSFDQTVSVFDARQEKPKVGLFNVTADVECVVWNTWNPAQFFVSSEDGVISCFDARSTGKDPLYSFQAHSEAASSICLSPKVNGMMASCSTDKSVKVWDLKAGGEGKIELTPVAEKAMAIGPIFDCKYCLDDPFLIAAGGGKGMVALWDTVDDANVDETFASRAEKNTK